MRRSVLRLVLRRRRVALLGWSAGMVAIALLVLAVYPVLRNHEGVVRFLRKLPTGMLKFAGIDPDLFLTGVGFVEAQLYTMVAPLVLSTMTILAGSAATAREEESGTIDLLLAQPLGRVRLVLEHFLAIVLLSAVVTLALAGTIAWGNESSGLDLTTRGIVGVNLGLWLLALLFGTLAMAVGAWSGRAVLAAGVAGGATLFAFFWHGFAPLFEPLRGLERYSPFHWYLDDHPALNGPTDGHLLLAGGVVIALAAACFAFARRDLRTTVRLLRFRITRASRVGPNRPPQLLRSVYGREIWCRRLTILWWMLALYGMAAALIAFWPTMRRSPLELEAMLKAVPEELFAMFGIKDPKVILTPAGFLSSRLYATLGPILVIAFAIGMGTSAIAGEERNGTLGLLAAQPISRDRIVRDKFLALLSWVALLPLGLIGVLIVGNLSVDLGLSHEGIVSANIGLALVALLFGTLALAVGAATGRPAYARGVATTAALATFLLNGIGFHLGVLAPLRMLSPFAWLLADSPPLSRGVDPAMLAAPAVIVALFAWATIAFRRRDLAA